MKDGDEPRALRETESRWERKRQIRIAELLRVTSEELAKTGYWSTSLDVIADRVDLTKASIYHYFPNKDRLVLAALEVSAGRVNENLRVVALGIGSPDRRLRALVIAQVRSIVATERAAGRLFQMDDWPAPIKSKIKASRTEHYTYFKAVVDEGLESGDFDVDDPRLALQLLHGAMNHTPNWLSARQLTDELLNGIADELMRLFQRQ